MGHHDISPVLGGVPAMGNIDIASMMEKGGGAIGGGMLGGLDADEFDDMLKK